MLNASFFASWTDRIPQSLSAPDFRQMCAVLGITQHVTTARQKTSTPAFSPCRYTPHAPRGRSGVIEMTMFVADYDAISAADAEAVLSWASAAKVEHCVYSTYSHGAQPAAYSFRLVIPLAAPVPAQQWAYVWPALATRLPVMPDTSCRDTSRLYGLAHTPYPEHAFAEYVPGAPWDIPAGDALTSAATLRTAAAHSSFPLLQSGVWPAQDELREWIKTLATYKTQAPQKQWLYDVARAIRDGRPFANLAQGRHETLLPLTAAMERKWPHVETSAIAELFLPSLQYMASDPGQHATQGQVDVQQRLEEIQRLLDGARDKRLAQQPTTTTAATQQSTTTTTATATRPKRAGKDDDTPYSLEELRLIAEQQGIVTPAPTLEQLSAALRRRWILHMGKSFYVLALDKGYIGPSQESDFASTPKRLLQRASSAGVLLTSTTATGTPRPRRLAELYEEYGSELEEITMSYTATHATAQLADRNVLTKQAAPIRAELRATAKEFPEVAAWLAALCGGANTALHNRVLDWLACAPKLDEPLAALYICGPSGVGKNLLALSLSRMFHTGGPVGLGTVLDGKWNSALLNCPIVVADEAMPSNATFENVCEFIGTTSRDLLRKYAANATLQGATRLLLTANKDNLMAFEHMGRKSYTKEQFAAVARRVLFVPADAAASTYLSSGAGAGLAQRWVKSVQEDPEQGEAVSRHILHLAATRQVTRQPGARFLVEGNFDVMLDKFVDTNPLISKIIEWCARTLRNPHPLLNMLKRPDLGQGSTMPELLRDAQNDEWYLALSPGTLHLGWAAVLGESRKDAPDAARLRPALEALQPHTPPSTQPGTYAIPVRHILRQNAQNGFDTQQAAQQLLQRAAAHTAPGAVPLDAVAPPQQSRIAAVAPLQQQQQQKVAAPPKMK